MYLPTFDVLAGSRIAHSDLPYPTLLQVDKIGACLIGLDLACTSTQPTVIDMSCRDLTTTVGG